MRDGIAILLLCAMPMAAQANVPWVDGFMQPSSFGRQPLSKKQQADQQFAKGRDYFLKARELEEKAATAPTDVRRKRYLENAYNRYRASADAFAASLRRARSENITPDYLPTLYLEMGDSLLKTGQHAQAAEAYRNAVDIAPAFFEAQFGFARSALIVGQLDDVQQGYAWLRREADIKAKAWTAIDELMAMMATWIPRGAAAWDNVSIEEHAAFAIWFEQTRDELKDEVRWSVIEKK
ncbi:MAG: hypothetical protein AB8G16_16775 [Gammaproteobacteria bacterium]